MNTATLLCAIAIGVAAALHALSGTGFAIVAAPPLLAVLGVAEGLRVALCLGLIVSVLVLAHTWRMVLWCRAAALTLPALVTIPAGMLVARSVPAEELLLCVGVASLGLVLIAVTPPASRTSSWLATPAGGVVAGGAAGFAHVLSALSAPILGAFAVRVKWTDPTFVATAQVVFIAYNVMALAAWRLNPGDLADLTALLPSLLGGLAVGTVLRARVAPGTTMAVMTLVSLGGATSAVVRGIHSLV